MYLYLKGVGCLSRNLFWNWRTNHLRNNPHKKAVEKCVSVSLSQWNKATFPFIGVSVPVYSRNTNWACVTWVLLPTLFNAYTRTKASLSALNDIFSVTIETSLMLTSNWLTLSWWTQWYLLTLINAVEAITNVKHKSGPYGRRFCNCWSTLK